MRILIVDDEQILLDQLRTALEAQRYMVDTALDGEEALDKLFESPADLVILDIMLPGVDGLEVLRALRREGDATPVLMLTAKGDIEDKIKGLDLGADDYLAKPFSFDELLARVRALLRRSGGQSESVLQVGDLRLDTVSREVSRAGGPVDLTAREFSILEFFLYNKNRAVSRFSLAEHVWGDAFDPFSMSNFMDVHIKNLRKKIGDTNGSVIQTIRGVGYIVKDEGP
ncbi:response regulator transcription factor [Pseudodesulfovibrio sp.]|uniref:response regulator transcription factor n=1 Tax=unclassified Pseudodesulfovibrio TaxID=2661612 RepID=UPI003AFF7BA2